MTQYLSFVQDIRYSTVIGQERLSLADTDMDSIKNLNSLGVDIVIKNGVIALAKDIKSRARLILEELHFLAETDDKYIELALYIRFHSDFGDAIILHDIMKLVKELGSINGGHVTYRDVIDMIIFSWKLDDADKSALLAEDAEYISELSNYNYH